MPALCMVQSGEARLRGPRRRLALVVGASGDQGRPIAPQRPVGWAKAHHRGRADAMPPVRAVGWAKAHHAPMVNRRRRGRRRRWAFAHPTAGPPAFRGAAAVRRFARRVGETHRRRSGVCDAGGVWGRRGKVGYHLSYACLLKSVWTKCLIILQDNLYHFFAFSALERCPCFCVNLSLLLLTKLLRYARSVTCSELQIIQH